MNSVETASGCVLFYEKGKDPFDYNWVVENTLQGNFACITSVGESQSDKIFDVRQQNSYEMKDTFTGIPEKGMYLCDKTEQSGPTIIEVDGYLDNWKPGVQWIIPVPAEFSWFAEGSILIELEVSNFPSQDLTFDKQAALKLELDLNDIVDKGAEIVFDQLHLGKVSFIRAYAKALKKAIIPNNPVVTLKIWQAVTFPKNAIRSTLFFLQGVRMTFRAVEELITLSVLTGEEEKKRRFHRVRLALVRASRQMRKLCLRNN